MDGNFVCVAGQVQYSVYNIETGGCQELFPYDSHQTYPHIKRVAKVQFIYFFIFLLLLKLYYLIG